MTRLEAYLGQIMTRFALNTHLNSSDSTVVGQVFASNLPSTWSKCVKFFIQKTCHSTTYETSIIVKSSQNGEVLPIGKNHDSIATVLRHSYQSVRFPCGNNVCPIVRISQVNSRTGIGYYNGLKLAIMLNLGYFSGLGA